MRVIESKKALLLRTQHPRRLAKIIPTAQLFKYKGKLTLAIPHRQDECRVLTNIGLSPPAPILHYYNWRRNELLIPQPFNAQKITSATLSLNPRTFVLNDLGTGKSLSALWAWDWLRQVNRAQKLLIICPLSTMERTWGDELFFHFPDQRVVMVHGSRARRKKLLAQDADVYVVNHHGVQIIADDLAKRPDITHIVLDEIAQVARNQSTDMWRSFNTIANKQIFPAGARAIWGLTATPTPNEPTDAYAQVKLVNPHKVPKYFSHFRDKVMSQHGPYTWLPRANAMDVVDEIMQPSIRFRMSDCTDLPPTIYMERTVELTPAQKKAYKSMEDELRAQVASGEVTAVNEAVKAGKLVQIACGVLYADKGERHIVGAEPRLRVVEEAIESSESKTIVFVPFVAAVAYVAAVIAQRMPNRTVAVIHGGVSKRDRDEIFGGFQQGNKPDVIVAQPAAMSHGLTLTKASTIVWYAPPNSAETYQQANGRIARPGQKLTTAIINVSGTPIERRMYARLKKKESMQNILLDRKVYREVY